MTRTSTSKKPAHTPAAPAASTFTVADYLLTRLKQLNVTDVFQIPGDYVKHFTQALEYFDGVNTIGAINELDASYAADAYARTRGLAAVSLQFGVSTYSALNAIAGAWVERSPIVVISATPGADMRDITDMYDVLFHHSTGDLDSDRKIFEYVTVKAITLSTNVGAAEQIDELLTDAITHRRPVYIACYKEVWGQPCPRPSRTPLKPRVVHSPVLALQNAVDQAWTQITAAKNPLIFAGVEILRFGLSDLLQKIIDASGFLYTTTTLGKTVLDEKGDKFIGTYSDAASIESVRAIVQASDCVLTLGAIITDDYLAFIESKYSDMVLADTDGVRAGYFKYGDVTMQDFMEALLVKFKKNKSYPIKAKAPSQPKYPEPWTANSDPVYDAKPQVITYNRFFQHTMKFLQDRNLLKDIVMTYGVSSSMYVATNAYGLSQGSFVSSAAWQCIGFETGAACGAQLGSGKRAWTVAGDGGFMMVCQSLSTLARNKLNAVIFVMSNQVYAIEQVYVDMSSFLPGPKHTFDAFDILPKWDYLALAKAFGAEGMRVETVDELKAALPRIAGIKNKPVLVEVVIPQKDLPGQMYRLGSE
ncbi:alpha-keto acid decarboxylase family protein [Montanilutibacter psychrotolerans]|uniref:Alpha-keto acid decarboxylase family protein n=1 Tax=Montanilutibacter psychrotolerans TaxID=1327343 RepID=A0A3M8SUC7_9GAMM|nr:thiamine pyrophosphate-dependent enzyme [Lysobacter psychrotolerans]RNF83076.1 alpha-keto acid decarboxylase family protein [Lysobacter psychrotolerans]